MRSEEKESFIENMSLLTTSGMSITTILHSIGQEIHSTRMRKIIERMKADIEEGRSLAQAMEHANIFPPHVISLIQIGEDSGQLSKNLSLITVERKKDRLFRSRLKSALLYPTFVMGLSILVSIGVSWFILPRLATVFHQLNLKLPLLTNILIAIGLFLSIWGWLAIPLGLIFFGLLLYVLFFARKTSFIGQTILFYLPGVSNLLKEIEIARFCYFLGTLLHAGLPITRSIELLKKTTWSRRYQYFDHALQQHIEDGNSFQKSFTSFPKINILFPITVQHMIIAGEQSGSLSDVLLKLSETFEEKIEATTKNLTTILEPILLFIVWIGVVFIALAVILPIYSIIGEFNNPASSPQTTTQEF